MWVSMNLYVDEYEYVCAQASHLRACVLNGSMKRCAYAVCMHNMSVYVCMYIYIYIYIYIAVTFKHGTR